MNDRDLKCTILGLKAVMQTNNDDVDIAIQRIMRWSPYSNKQELLKAAEQIKKEQKADWKNIGKYWNPTHKTLHK